MAMQRFVALLWWRELIGEPHMLVVPRTPLPTLVHTGSTISTSRDVGSFLEACFSNLSELGIVSRIFW